MTYKFTNAQSRKLTSNGFSLVEFLVVVFIFAIGLLGLAALQIMSVRGNHNGRQRSTSIYLANSVMERILAEGQMSQAGFPPTRVFTAPTVTDDVVNSYNTFDINANAVTGNAAIYTVTWSRRAYRNGSSSTVAGLNLKEFVVNVIWNETDAQGATLEKAISMSRYVRF